MEVAEEGDFKVVEEVGVETEEAEFREDGIKGLVGVVVVIKTEVETIRIGVEDMEEVIVVEVTTRTEEAVIRVEWVVIRIEVVVTKVEGVVIRIEGVVEEGVVVVVAEGERITIDKLFIFSTTSLKVCDIIHNSEH